MKRCTYWDRAIGRDVAQQAYGWVFGMNEEQAAAAHKMEVAEDEADPPCMACETCLEGVEDFSAMNPEHPS